jgi:hypothetical protein
MMACTPIGSPATTSSKYEDATPEAAQLPCVIDQILRGNCQACHGRPTRETAPMSLTTWQDLHATAPSRQGLPSLVYERIAQRIHDSDHPMPPRDRPQLTEAELSALDIWLAGGARQGEACSTSTGNAPPSDASADAGAPTGAQPSATDGTPAPNAGSAQPMSDGGTSSTAPIAGESSRPRPPKAGAGGAPDAASTEPPVTTAVEDAPVIPNESECEYIDLLARSDTSGAPLQIAAASGDEYHCFLFDLNFDAPRHALAVAPVLDNVAVMHHWMLYSLDAYSSRGLTVDCKSWFNGVDYRILSGGGPGSDPWYLPKDVGLELGRGLFVLEVHHNNSSNQATTDKSGARICTTRTLRPKSATISWLGAELFNVPAKSTDYTVSNTCRPERQEPIHLLRYWPHMNRLGKRASLRVERPNGTTESLHNAPYALDAQRSYPIPYVLAPGESLVTTCYYDNPGDTSVGLGLKASDEMCNHFVAAYPARALTNRNPSAWSEACVSR